MIGRDGESPVLVAEDDPDLLAAFSRALRSAGLPTIPARSARVVLDCVAFHRPAVAVIDLAMEEGRGWEALYAIAPRPDPAILAVDRAGDTLVRTGALSAGAHDVIGPPFDGAELVARTRSLARRQRTGERAPSVLRYRDLVMDVASHEVQLNGRPVELTAQQFALLRALLEARGATLARAQLLARIAALDAEPPSERAVDLHMSRLRRRLGHEGRDHIEAVYGIGYRLAAATTNGSTPPAPIDPVLDGLTEAIVLTDEQLRVVTANEAAIRLIGRPRSDIVGRSCGDVLGCLTTGGTELSGRACIGRAAFACDAAVGGLSAIVHGLDGAVPVTFSHVAIRSAGGERLLAIELRPEG